MESSSETPEPLVVGVPRETADGERRVALIPDTVSKLVSLGCSVVVESGAGSAAYFPDETYRDAGATIIPDLAAVFEQSDIIAKVQRPTPDEVQRLRPGSLVISFIDPLRNGDLINQIAERGVTAFSMTAIPRVTRAQSMDALSSMSTIAGYKAVVLAASALGRLFPMLMTAAGTLAPARVLVLGAGVAGLQALATARRLGAVTEGFDTRAVVREQVQSVGATFIEMPVALEGTEGEGGYAREMSEDFYHHEQEAIREHVARADVVITTALIPGKPAPQLITEAMVDSMRPGSVIVDLAAEAGGNCTLTRAGETVEHRGVTILGPLNLPSSVPMHASQMYSRNVLSVITHVIKDGHLELDFEDEIVRAACVARPEQVHA